MSKEIQNTYDPDSQTYYDEVYGSFRWKFRFAVLGAITGWIATIITVSALVMLIPLKQFEIVVMTVDKQTGFVELAPRLDDVDLTRDKAIIMGTIWRYVQARESYNPETIKYNYELVQLMSTGSASADYAALHALTNKERPENVYGKHTRITVEPNTVIFFNDTTAQVRFRTLTRNITDTTSIERFFIATVKFQFTPDALPVKYLVENPTGFQTYEYTLAEERAPILKGFE